MRRREFIKVIAGSTSLWPLAVRGAQQGKKVARVGVLWHAGSPQEEEPYFTAFRKGLRDLGYVDGQNIILEDRFPAEQYERFNRLAAELVELKLDVLVAVTTPAALAAQRATAIIPVVFVLVADPVASKLVSSIARPGGNITGLSMVGVDVIAKRYQLLNEIASSSHVAVLVNPANPNFQGYLRESQVAAGSLGTMIEPMEAQTVAELESVFSAMDQKRVDGIIVQPDGFFFRERVRIAELALRRQLPTMFWSKETAGDGGLISYGIDNVAMFSRASVFVDKLLKGTRPLDLPVELPTKFQFIINLKTAKALGLAVSPSLLARADDVIE